MITALSLPSGLDKKARRTASYMGIPRNKLYAVALEEYINKYNGEMVTRRLNEVYGKINTDEFSKDIDVGIESLREFTKNDSW